MKKEDYSEKLLNQWKKDEKAFFEGWDFSYIKRRMIEPKPPWNYLKIAKKLIRKSKAVLDMATGGGEVFSEILSTHKPKKIIAIEGYKPNVSVARKNLRKFGAITIYASETKKLQFKDGEFDLVLNRHGGLNQESIKEIYRILCPGGILLTQQVGGGNLKDLRKEFHVKPKWPENNLENRRKFCINAGFKILNSKKWKGKFKFKDVGAIVYFLKAIPWAVDGFSVNTHSDYLKKLQKNRNKNKKLEFDMARFMILAKKEEK